MHPNAELLRREAEAWESGDHEAVLTLYAPDAVYHYPGNNPLAGDYRGHDGLREYLGRRGELLSKADEIDGHYHDFLANDEHGIQLIHITARKGDRSADWRGVFICHFTDGKIGHAWIHVDPQAEVDDFLTSLA